MRRVLIGTRKSRLALAQTEIVADRLRQLNPDLRVKIVPVVTTGDRQASARELRQAGKGVFVKEIESKLLRGRIDLAVHSLKDMPTDLPSGLILGAVLEREDSGDVFISRSHQTLDKLASGAVIGTSSLRRRAFLRAAYPHLAIADLRGNLDTRLAKLQEPDSGFEGIVVAAAGLKRLVSKAQKLEPQSIPQSVLPPAPGQGAICIEIREDRRAVRELIAPLDHEATRQATEAERSILRRLEGGCNVPIAACGELSLGLLKLTCWVAALDGSRVVSGEALGAPEDADAIAGALEVILKNKGVDEVVKQIRERLNGTLTPKKRKPHRNGRKRTRRVRSDGAKARRSASHTPARRVARRRASR